MPWSPFCLAEMRFLPVALLSAFLGSCLADVNNTGDRTKWGPYDINTDYYSITPDTGVTRFVLHLLNANEV